MFDKYTTAGKLYKKVVTGFIVVTVIATAIFYSYLTNQNSRRSSAAAGDSATISAVPPSTIMTFGQEYTTKLRFQSSTHQMAVQGYDMNIGFDKTKIIITHINYLMGQASAGLGDTDSTLSQVNLRGAVYVNGEIPSVTPVVLVGGEDVVSITYKVNDIGAVAVVPNFSTTFTTTGNFVELISGNLLSLVPINQLQFTAQTDTFTPAPGTPTPPAGNTVINLKLRFQGITAKPQVTTPLTVQVKVASAQTGQLFTRSVDFTSDDVGLWTGTTSIDLSSNANTAGTKYSVYVKGPKHLKKRICTNTPTESTPGTYACAVDNISLSIGSNTIDATGIYQLAGDLPVTNGVQNGLIDSEDTSYIRLHFGDSSQAVLDIADVNLDGAVSTQDFSLVIAALGVKYDDPEETLSAINTAP